MTGIVAICLSLVISSVLSQILRSSDECHSDGSYLLKEVHVLCEVVRENTLHINEIGLLKAELSSLQTAFENQTGIIEEMRDRLSELENMTSKAKGSSSIHKPKSCKVIKEANPKSQDGVYTIYPDGRTATWAYCDMTTDGGGWTVFQRRVDGEVDFYKNWDDYKMGFGNLAKEHWLGNDVLHELTGLGTCMLRIDMTSLTGDTVYAIYSNFTIKSENQAYQMDYGKYQGTVGDALSNHKGQKFTTPDRDNDSHTKMHCSLFRHGSWWYSQCAWANLNGQYGVSSTKGMMWYPWKSKGQTMYINMSKMMVKC